jgi:four helix bundle protein
MHMKMCRRESKETRYWLRLVDRAQEPSTAKERETLIIESTELLKIFSSIIRKSE